MTTLDQVEHTVRITAADPSVAGALAGFIVDCSCGFMFRTAFEMTARLDASAHRAFMAGKPRELCPHFVGCEHDR